MARCVVFQTKGKLDLRSLTVFGLNAKPETTSPIGFFGTGLKYAVAVLARRKIPVSFWIDGKQWVIEADPSSFRNKEFTELYICSTTIGGLIKKRIKLPFTTQLGRTWDLWQAFRELESNTRDEKGMTFLAMTHETRACYCKDGIETQYPSTKGQTIIVVQSEEFVQEYLDREKTFLPDGLTARDGTDRIQVFARTSKYVYFRGIRIMDLKEPSQNTYNLLCQIELTEDRTAKEEWWVKHEIENFLAKIQEPEILDRVVTAPAKALERELFRYSTVGLASPLLLDTIARRADKAAPEYRQLYDRERPPELNQIWLTDLIKAVESGNWDKVEEIAVCHVSEVVQALKNYAEAQKRAKATRDWQESSKDEIPF